MLITNGKIITFDEGMRILEDNAIHIQDNLISDIKPQTILGHQYPNDEILDAKGQYILPGNICAHTHFYGAFARGMGIPGPPPKDFPEILQKLWWPLDLALDEDSVRLSSEVMLIDAIRHGTTTLIDHHASPNFIDGSLDVISDSVKQAGLRASLSYEVTDRNGVDGAEAGIRENVRFINKCQNDPQETINGCFGLHASLTVSDRTLEAVADVLPDGYGIHIHVAEHDIDEFDSLSKSGMRVIDRLNRFKLLGPNSIAVHAVHIDAKEMSILADTGTWVTHQPRSNMNNAVGVPRVEDMLRMGIPVCIGTDGFSSTMWDEWKYVYLVHKLWNRDPRWMNGADVIKMGVNNNRNLAQVFFPNAPLGQLIPGAYADIIFVDYYPFTPMNSGNLPWHILFGFNESQVTTTIVSGKVLMKDRQLMTLDEEKITMDARAVAPDVWERYEKFVGKY